MRTIQYISIIFSLILLNACQPAANNEDTVANESVELAIEGMVCAVGCAKTIEKEMAEVSGITNSEVKFEEGIATFKFDNSKLSVYDIQSKIEGMNEGQYKVEIIESRKVEVPEISAGKKSNDKNVSGEYPSFSFPRLITYFMNNL